MIVLLALNSSAWAAASGAPPAGRVSPPTRATTPLAPMASSSVVARPAPQSKGLDLSAATPEAMPSPFYKRWPFWTAVGVAVGAAVVVAAGILARGNNDVNLGYPTFGTKEY